MRRPLVAATVVGVLLTPLAASPAAQATAPAGSHHRNDTYSFGIVTDVQYADQDTPAGSTRYYRDALPKLRKAVKDLNRRDLAFTMHLGDLIDKDAKSFDEILPVWDKLRMPTHHLLGNHEFTKTGMYSDAVVKKLSMPNQYYAWSKGDWRYIVLDTTRISTFANPEGSENHTRALKAIAELKAAKAPNAQTWNGGVGAEQMAWLKGQLKTAKKQHQKAIVFGHAPIMGVNAHNAFDSDQVRATLEQAGNVVAYFCGHDHAGRYERHKGIHYVNLMGFVEQPRPTTQYSIIEVSSKRVLVDGIGREPDRILDIPRSVQRAVARR